MSDSMKPHPLAKLMPEMTEDEFAGLVADLKRKPGLIEPIVTHEGMILDGWHRYRACRAAGIEPNMRPFMGDDPAAYVVSVNIHRRHLTPGQRAVLIVQATQAEGKLRARGDAGRGDRSAVRADLSDPQIAAKAGVSERVVSQAKRVVREDPKLTRQVMDGLVGLDRADAILGERAAKTKPKKAPQTSPGDEWKNHRAVQDILAFVRVWDQEMPKTIASIKARKFSPEAKRFLGHKLRPTVRRLTDFCDWLDR